MIRYADVLSVFTEGCFWHIIIDAAAGNICGVSGEKGCESMKYREQNCLIAYFSHAGQNYASGKLVDLTVGNTERVACMIRQYTGGALFHIRRDIPYPYDYKETVAAARQEKADGARPALERQLDSVAPYDVVFLGYPNWCGTMPMAVWTFLESHDFGGKLIMPFCTHEGSGWGTSLQDLHDLCPTATIGQGLTLFGTTILDAEDDVRRWLQQ